MGSTKLCRLSGVFWTERRCFVQVKWCRDQDAVGVYNTGGKEKGGGGGKKGYIYSSSGDFLVQGSTCQFCWLTNTKRPSLHLAELPGTSWTTSLEMRFSSPGEDSLPRWALVLHYPSVLPLRPCPSWSKLSSSQVVPTVQPSNTATNA